MFLRLVLMGKKEDTDKVLKYFKKVNSALKVGWRDKVTKQHEEAKSKSNGVVDLGADLALFEKTKLGWLI